MINFIKYIRVLNDIFIRDIKKLKSYAPTVHDLIQFAFQLDPNYY